MAKTTNTIKVTRVEAMNICRELISNTERADKDEVIAVIDKMIESLSKKSVSKADKARIEENEAIRSAILEVLAEKGKQRVSDITKAVNGRMSADYTSNKVSAQVTALKDNGSIIREVEKKIAYFSIAQPKAPRKRGEKNKKGVDNVFGL